MAIEVDSQNVLISNARDRHLEYQRCPSVCTAHRFQFEDTDAEVDGRNEEVEERTKQ